MLQKRIKQSIGQTSTVVLIKQPPPFSTSFHRCGKNFAFFPPTSARPLVFCPGLIEFTRAKLGELVQFAQEGGGGGVEAWWRQQSRRPQSQVGMSVKRNAAKLAVSWAASDFVTRFQSHYFACMLIGTKF